MKPIHVCILALCACAATTAAAQFVEITPAAPIFGETPGFNGPGFPNGMGSVYVPFQEHAIYRINGTVVADDSDYYYSFGASVTVTVEPAVGYCFPSNAVTGWTRTFGEWPPPPAPQFIEPLDEYDYGCVIVSGGSGIVYSANNRVLYEGEPEYFPFGCTVTVTVWLEEQDFFFPSNAVTKWTHTFGEPAIPSSPCPEPVLSLGIAASAINGQISAAGSGTMTVYLNNTISITSTATAAGWLSEHNVCGYTSGTVPFSIPSGTAALAATATTSASARTVTWTPSGTGTYTIYVEAFTGTSPDDRQYGISGWPGHVGGPFGGLADKRITIDVLDASLQVHGVLGLTSGTATSPDNGELEAELYTPAR